jgi:hypothetical protein
MLRQYFLELYRKNKMIMYKMYNMYTMAAFLYILYSYSLLKYWYPTPNRRGIPSQIICSMPIKEIGAKNYDIKYDIKAVNPNRKNKEDNRPWKNC